jgi:hypothetical protein
MTGHRERTEKGQGQDRKGTATGQEKIGKREERTRENK